MLSTICHFWCFVLLPNSRPSLGIQYKVKSKYDETRIFKKTLQSPCSPLALEMFTRNRKIRGSCQSNKEIILSSGHGGRLHNTNTQDMHHQRRTIKEETLAIIKLHVLINRDKGKIRNDVYDLNRATCLIQIGKGSEQVSCVAVHSRWANFTSLISLLSVLYF